MHEHCRLLPKPAFALLALSMLCLVGCDGDDPVQPRAAVSGSVRLIAQQQPLPDGLYWVVVPKGAQVEYGLVRKTSP